MGSNRVVQLDFVRSVAVTLVILFHFNVYSSRIPFYNTFISNGGVFGVTLFFILSGYLMTSFYTQYQNSSLSPVKALLFYKSRFFRIFPLFVVTTLVFYLIKDDIAVYRESNIHMSFSELLTGFLFINTKLFMLNIVLWTLKIEIIFYLVFPFIGQIIQKLLLFNRFELLIVLPCVILLFSLLSSWRHWGIVFFDNLGGLAVGMLVRIVKLIIDQHKQKVSINMLLFLIVNCCLFVLLYFFVKTNLNDKDFYFKFCVSLLLGGVFFTLMYIDSKTLFFKIMSAKVFYYIALISYSLYLLHFNVYYNLVTPLLKKVGFGTGSAYGILSPVLSLLITVPLSLLTYFLIEKPALGLKNIKVPTFSGRKTT